MAGEPDEEELKPYQPEPIKNKKSTSKDSSDGDEETVSMEEDEEPAPAATTEDGDFDPMSVLEGNVDSDIMPALPDSAIKDDVMVDMSDSGSDREA